MISRIKRNEIKRQKKLRAKRRFMKITDEMIDLLLKPSPLAKKLMSGFK